MKIREHRLVTQGEALFCLIHRSLVGNIGQNENHPWLARWTLFEAWSEFIEQATCLFFVGRLIRLARHLDSLHCDEKLVRRELSSFINNDVGLSRDELHKWVQLTISAADVSRLDCSDGIAKSMKAWAKKDRPICYLCGVNLDFGDKSNAKNTYTLEHIWPRSFGGDSSDIDNLLPACKLCNSARKKGFAMWSATAIHSVNLKVMASENARSRLEGPIKYAIHQRHLWRVAVENRVTFKTAALKVGPWQQIPEFIDSNDSGHFFNLKNHLA